VLVSFQLVHLAVSLAAPSLLGGARGIPAVHPLRTRHLTHKGWDTHTRLGGETIPNGRGGRLALAGARGRGELHREDDLDRSDLGSLLPTRAALLDAVSLTLVQVSPAEGFELPVRRDWSRVPFARFTPERRRLRDRDSCLLVCIVPFTGCGVVELSRSSLFGVVDSPLCCRPNLSYLLPRILEGERDARERDLPLGLSLDSAHNHL
jgi:hypothetical protein